MAKEMENSEDNSNVEEGVNKFIEWLLNGKMEIKAYPSAESAVQAMKLGAVDYLIKPVAPADVEKLIQENTL